MPNVDLGQYQVLLVDDEPFIRQLTGMLLKQLGCPNILESGNGAEALAQLDRPGAHVDLILSDLNMPDMDGVEFVRHLAARKGCPPLAFLSGAESGLLRAAEALGRAYFLEVLGALAKPVNKEALVAVLGRMAEERVPRAQRRGVEITETDLGRGIEARELVFHYQPKIEIASGRVSGAEALVRWQHPQHGLLFPDRFIAMAESGPLIGPLTEALVEIGLAQVQEWQGAGLHPHLGINLSPSMLSDVTLPDRFAASAARYGVPAESIVFEITETGVAREELVYLEIVTRLRMKGFHLSVDDFGTGQSSLQRLEALPFGELKIDRQFVHGAAKNPAKAAILEASIGLARTLGQKSVAEGVELKEDWELLRRLGCDVAQGYFVAKPMPAAAFPDWVAEWSARNASAV
ncbi:EAL domain-containing protein [Dongia sp.]|uniref:EAL domain-containing response regulator n=1 Tax=Dongia sp. TaxID=1977262 RepID=UPI003750859C